MSFFSKLFGGLKGNDMNAQLTETKMQVESSLKPIKQIGMGIIKASTKCRDQVKSMINASTEKERQEREIFIFYEFIYFYMHMTMRQAFTILSESDIECIQSYIGPVISSVAIDSYFAHWTTELKEKMTNDFYDTLNNAELEYSACTYGTLANIGDDNTKELLMALFTKLASNISMLAECDTNILKGVVMNTALEEWQNMHLDANISQLKQINWECLR